ncbi:MAG: site-specific integrase [Candidatus Obscuribacterales bacterium]|nr:site-specific integrase [Candidatus Obscuribacterales bacterium]
MPQKNPPRKSSQKSVKDGLFKRGSSWYIRCMVDGILYRKSIGPEKTKAQTVLAEIKSQRALHRATGEMSGLETLFKKKERKKFEEVADTYLAERPHLKDSTKRGYEEILKNYLIPAFGHLSVDQITEEHIAKFQAEVSATVSATRTNNIMGPLRYILKMCLRRKYIPDNPAINVPPLREEEPNIDPLSGEELNKVITALKPHQRPLFLTLAWTGARPDELFALRWSDINFQRNEIHINKGRVRGKEGTPKTKAGKRVIHMFSIVKEVLLELKNNRTQHVEGYVFLNKHGQPFDKHADREWRTALKKAEIRHRPSYQLRHTFASLCLQQGLQPTWVAKMLGHSPPQITFKHYTRFIDDSSNINEKRLEEFLSRSQEPSKDSFGGKN